jgi:hypothetical protein
MGRNVKRERSAAWCAGLAFGRARRRPTPLDLEPWALLNLRDVFLRAYREGRRSAPRLVQARPPFPPAA